MVAHSINSSTLRRWCALGILEESGKRLSCVALLYRFLDLKKMASQSSSQLEESRTGLALSLQSPEARDVWREKISLGRPEASVSCQEAVEAKLFFTSWHGAGATLRCPLTLGSVGGAPCALPVTLFSPGRQLVESSSWPEGREQVLCSHSSV